MKCDFTKILQNNKDDILNEFMDKYATCVDSYDKIKIAKAKNYYKQIIESLANNMDSKHIVDTYSMLTIYKMANNVPYIMITNEIYGLKNILLSKIATVNDSSKILNLISLFKEIHNAVAKIYLSTYTTHLIVMNKKRLESLSDIIDKEVIKHYEDHLFWFTNLTKHIKNLQKDAFPEVNENLCAFGKWLHDDAKLVIQSDIRCRSLESMHAELHLFAKKIFLQLNDKEYYVLISYLEKCELLSLKIGTELTLVDNIQMNKKVTKDFLTGALNRNSLKSIFTTQYELSYSTGNSFVIAMCDLDYFKRVNDNYGHLAGDKVLKIFVETVKKYIRNSDIIIRYGGEEFIILLSAIKKMQGYKVLQKIRETFEELTIEFDNKKIKSTVSMGMIEIKPDENHNDKHLDEYLMIVDKMLYSAKANGRNRIEYL